ncbi:MAG: T9SS C-terminal target domain-containing protein, partial [Balneolaceae bacterium]
YAAEIWSYHLSSDIPIRIEARWRSLASNVLGSAGPTIFYTLNGEGIDSNTLFTAAQASAMTGIDLINQPGASSAVNHHIVVNMNCNYAAWYLGTSAAPPSGTIDFVTVVLHEIGHGIGFAGSIRGDTARQTAQWFHRNETGNPQPVVFDVFANDGYIDPIFDTSLYPNNSTGLYNAVTGRSQGMFFSGMESEIANRGNRIRLYAPLQFRQGSSYSHLDQNAFSATPNALMRPRMDMSMAIHSPGPVFCGMLDDMLWPLGPGCLELLEQTVALARPSLLNPVHRSSESEQQLLFEWMPVESASNYRIQIASESDFINIHIDDTLNTTEYVPDVSFDLNSNYYWRVRALSDAGNSFWSTIWRFSTKRNVELPEPVSLVVPLDGSEGLMPGFLMQWSRAERAERYEIQIATDREFTNTVFTRTTNFNAINSSGSLDFLTNFYWRVRATNQAGLGDWSDTWSFSTIIEKPEPVILGAPMHDDNQIPVTPQFNWNPSSRAFEYIIQVSTREDFSELQIERTLNETSYNSPEQLDFATIYFWRVKATNDGGESNWSEVNSFVTEVRNTRIDPNYPNPFNSSTTLRYQLSATQNVVIDIFDITGRRVAIVVDEQQSPGVYFARLNSANFASGTYLVRFVAGDVTNIQKMSVIK